jgi:hypothetical protein
MTSARGLRNRNPGNIVVSGWTQWQPGYTGPEPQGRFGTFATMADGVAALLRLLLVYREQHGLTTVRGIIDRWAPPSENNTSAYVLAVSRALGVQPDDVLPQEAQTYIALARAIVAHENGRDAAVAVTDTDYADAANTVFGTASQAAGGPSSPAPSPAPQPAAVSPPAPAAPPAPSIGDRIMGIPALVAAAGQALLPTVIDLFRARGTGTATRNADILEAAKPVIPALVEIAREVAGGSAAGNEQAVVEKILGSAELQQQLRAQVALRWSDVEPFLRFEEESREKSRTFVETMTGGDSWRAMGAGLLIGVLSLTIVVGGGAMFWNLMDSPQLDPGQKGLVLGALIAAFTTTVGFWFGSSRSSQVKDQTIAEQARR